MTGTTYVIACRAPTQKLRRKRRSALAEHHRRHRRFPSEKGIHLRHLCHLWIFLGERHSSAAISVIGGFPRRRAFHLRHLCHLWIFLGERHSSAAICVIGGFPSEKGI
jgi:hypothetical protein